MNSPEIKKYIHEHSNLFWYIPEDKKKELSTEFLVETIVKNSLKSDYPPPKEVAFTPIFAAHHEFFKSHMPFGQSPARTLPRSKIMSFDHKSCQSVIIRICAKCHSSRYLMKM